MVIGVDPGLQGALAYLSDDGELLDVKDMPTISVKTGKHKRKQIDRFKLAVLLRLSAPGSVFVVEQVSARPNQGVSSMFKFGMNYEAILMGAEMLGRHVELVSPQAWKKHFDLIKKDKDKAVGKAIEVFPDQMNVFLKSKIGRADAALIGCYGYQLLRKQKAA